MTAQSTISDLKFNSKSSMHNITRTTCKLLTIGILSAQLLQGCAVYPTRQPVHYPPPPPPPPIIKKHTMPQAEPLRQPREQSNKSNAIAANFSRQAAEDTRQGRLDLATATLERGLRAVPKDAMLWSQLAEVKLQQGLYLQARSLAAKSNSLAGANRTIVQKNQWIIKESLKRAAGRK